MGVTLRPVSGAHCPHVLPVLLCARRSPGLGVGKGTGEVLGGLLCDLCETKKGACLGGKLLGIYA